MRTGKMTFNLDPMTLGITVTGQTEFEQQFDCTLTFARIYYGTFTITSNNPTFANLSGFGANDGDNDGNNFIFKTFYVDDYTLRFEVRDVAGIVSDLCNLIYLTISTGNLTHNLPYSFMGDQSIYYVAPEFVYFNNIVEAGTGTVTLEVSVNNGASWSSRSFSAGGWALNPGDILRMTCSGWAVFKTITLY